MDAREKRFPEHRFGLRPSEKELPNRRSVTKYPWLNPLCTFTPYSYLYCYLPSAPRSSSRPFALRLSEQGVCAF
jgi:hypothetical protein